MRGIVRCRVAAIAIIGAVGVLSCRGGAIAEEPVGVIGGDAKDMEDARLFERLSRFYTDEGLVVRVSSRIEGDDRAKQLLLAERLASMNMVPDQRVAHFSWVEREDPHLRITGWSGSIRNVRPTRSGYLVSMRVIPRVASLRGGAITVLDHVQEVYEVSGTTARLIDITGNTGLKGIAY